MASSPIRDPLVSVVIPTHRRPSYLRRAVRTVLAQTYEPIELIIVDDNPQTPATKALDDEDLDGLAGFQIIRGEDHSCANAARKTGVGAASGNFIAFLDDDDQWIENKVKRQVKALEDAPPSVGVVYSGVIGCRSDGETEQDIPPRVSGDLTRALLCRNVVGTMSVVMVTADAAMEVPLDDRFPNWGDIAWFIDLSRKYAFRRLPEPLTIYDHESPSRLSDDLEKTITSYELFLKKYRPIVANFGPLFERKVRAWAAYRVGHTAFFIGEYPTARRYFLRALLLYPDMKSFLPYLLSSLGGGMTHSLAKRMKHALP